MAVTPVTFGGISAISSASAASPKSTYQPVRAAQASTPRPFQVTLTSEALAKSLESLGYPVSFISAKLGLDTRTVDEYMGIAIPANVTDTFKSTYTPPKSTYVAPKAPYTESQALAQDRALLSSDLTRLATDRYAAIQLISSATKKIT